MKYITGNPKRLIFSCFVLMLTSFSALAAEPVITEQKAADINGVVISKKDLNNEYRQILKQRGTPENDVSTEQAIELKKELLDSLIDQELLYQESQKKNIVVSEETVASSIGMVKEKFESEDDYQKALIDADIQGNDLENRIKRRIAINMLVNEYIIRDIAVSDDESRIYYDAHPNDFIEPEQIRASHILVSVDKEDGESKKVAAKEKIEVLQRKIEAGEDFEQLARENSDCPSSEKGGDLGYFKRGAMVKEFEDAAFPLALGEVSDVVETQFGYHLIKVTDKKDAETIPYDTVKDDLQNYLKRQKLQTEVSSLLETLRKDAKIEIYL